MHQVVEFFKPTMVAGGEDGVHFTLNRFLFLTRITAATSEDDLDFSKGGKA